MMLNDILTSTSEYLRITKEERRKQGKFPIHTPTRIRQARQDRMWAQRDMAVLTGVSQATYSRFENKDVKTIDTALANKVSEILDVPVDDLWKPAILSRDYECITPVEQKS